MARNAVWTANDVDAIIYLANADGSKASIEPVLRHCYMQSVSVTGALNYQRRPVTGRPNKKIVNEEWGDYQMTVGHFYLSKESELDLSTVFNRRQKLYIELVCNLEGDNPANADVHVLRHAYAELFSISASDNQNVNGEAKFCAEEFE